MGWYYKIGKLSQEISGDTSMTTGKQPVKKFNIKKTKLEKSVGMNSCENGEKVENIKKDL